MSDSAEFCRLPRLLPRFLMIDGPPAAGKSTLCSIVASFDKVELERIEEIYDYVGYLYGFGKIEKDAAIMLLRVFSDLHIYNLYLSRNVNFRWRDHSGIFRSPNPGRYLRRMFANDRDAATAAILAERPIMQQHAHYQMEHINIHFDAHADTLQVIEVLRHPLELLAVQHDRGYAGNVCDSLYNVFPCLRHGEGAVHLLAAEWKGEIHRMNPFDRAVRILHGYQMRSYETYRALPEDRLRRVFVAMFDDIITDPFGTADRIANFLGTRTTRKTPKTIRRAGCPRKPSQADRDRTFVSLKDNCNKDNLARVDEMIANYETRWIL